MEQAPQRPGRSRKGFRIDPRQLVDGFGCREVVAHGTNPAKPLNQHGYLPVGVSLNETFKTPEFDNVKVSLFHLAGIVEVYGNPAVSFHTGHRVYNDFFAHGSGSNHI
jgi:hypothetical protein